MKIILSALIAVVAVATFSGCKAQMTARDPRQELSVNPVKLEDGTVAVEIKYTISNPDKNPVTFKFSSGKQWDAWILRDGKEIFRESAGKMYTQAFTQLTLQPGDKKEYKTTWNLSSDAGAYEAGTKYEVHAGLVTKDLNPLSVTVVPVP